MKQSNISKVSVIIVSAEFLSFPETLGSSEFSKIRVARIIGFINHPITALHGFDFAGSDNDQLSDLGKL